MHSEAFDVGYNVKYIRKILWTSPNNVPLHLPKKFIFGGYGPPDPSPAPPPIGGGILWNSLPTEIKASETKAIFGRKLASSQANC